MKRRSMIPLALTAAALTVLPLLAQAAGEIRIAHIRSLTGPLEAYGKQTTVGLMLGLEYATGGTMMV
ncbi:MAG: ABC transporter permease, partial [Rubrivivax sp.]|nr:ABC transporter permease [Rubrivivax sp.]